MDATVGRTMYISNGVVVVMGHRLYYSLNTGEFMLLLSLDIVKECKHYRDLCCSFVK